MGKKGAWPWVWLSLLLPLLLPGDGLPGKEEGSAPAGAARAFHSPVPHGFLARQGAPDLPADPLLPRWLLAMADSIAFEHGVPPRLVKSIILTESRGDPASVSPRGAKGLMQLMPVVLKEYGVKDPHDPAANIRGGVRYLESLLREFPGDLSLALAAYNAGPTAVRRHRGIPPFAETRAFVRRVKDLLHSAENPFHLSPPPLLVENGAAEKVPGPPRLFTGTPRSLGLFLTQLNTKKRKDQTQ